LHATLVHTCLCMFVCEREFIRNDTPSTGVDFR
jgi:hypothetical protein